MTGPAPQPAPKRRPAAVRPDAVAGGPHSQPATPDPDTTAAVTEPAPLEPDGAYALVTGQGQQGAGFTFKVLKTGALFRCQIMRNPNQPRFWCITIFLCLDGGSPDTEQPRWLSNDRFTREEMSEALDAVRSDIPGWLAEPSRAELRKWVLSQASRSPMASNPSLTRAASAT